MILLEASQFPRMQRQALEQLSGEIASGTFRNGETLGNEVELADRLGVSRNTVRNLIGTLETAGAVRRAPRCGIFLNEAFGLAAPETEDAEDVAAPVTYIRWCDSLMESEISTGLEHFTQAHGLELHLVSVHQSLEQLLAVIDHLEHSDTLVFAPLEMPEVRAALERALERGVRVLQVDRFLDGLAAPAITFDDYTCGVLATRHLIAMTGGPVWFFGYLHPVSGHKRFQGWRDCMLENGFLNFTDYIVPCGHDAIDAEQRPKAFYRDAFREFYRNHQKERIALFCMGDLMALDVYEIAAEFGRQVGRDIRLVGSGDIACARSQKPPLSSIRVDQVRMGEAAGAMLLNWPRVAGYCRVLPLELIERESSLGVQESTR